MKNGLVVLPILLGALTMPGIAGADVTLGQTAQPSGSTLMACPPAEVIGEATSDSSTSYLVPSPGGRILSWSINTAGDSPGAAVVLWALRPSQIASFTLVRTDTETLANQLPAGGIETFTPATPIDVNAGDTFAVSASGGTVNCAWFSGSTPSADSVFISGVPASMNPGQPIGILSTTGPGNAFASNLAVTLTAPNEDAGVIANSGPQGATVGSQALLSGTVTNNGPGEGPVTVTDNVPSGLQIGAVAVGDGSCATAGQTVTCTVTGLAAGASVPLEIAVTPTAAKSYSNTVSVAAPAGAVDPVTTNNVASSTLDVASAPSRATVKCVVVALKGTPEKAARKVLNALNCTIGKVKRVASRTVAKGDVISTTPGAGSYVTGRQIGLKISSGPKPKKHKKKK